MKNEGSWLTKLFTWVEKNEVLLLILCLVALLRLPTLYEVNRYADEDIYLTIGQGLRRGLVLYKEIFDNKPPLIYLLAMIAGNVMRFRLVLLIWNLINVTFVWKLAKKFLTNKWVVGLTTLLFAIFTTLPMLEGEIANGEIFMILPATLAVYLVFDKEGRPRPERGAYFWSGIFWSAAFLFKSPPLVEFFGLLFFLTIYLSESFPDLGKRLLSGRVWLLLAGFLLPILTAFGMLSFQGAGFEFLRSAFLNNIGYLSSWGPSGTGAKLLSGGLATRAVILGLTLAIVWVFRKRIGSKFGFVSIWFLTALFGSLLPGRPYPHYLIEIVGPVALLIGFLLSQFSIVYLLFGLSWFGLLGAGVIGYKFWYYKSLPYYQNFLEFMAGKKTREQYYGFWGKNILENVQAAKYIRMVTGKNDKIFVWGTEPAIYALSERQPAIKYTVAYHIKDVNAQDEVIDKLAVESPKIIVVLKGESEFGQLSGLLQTKYVLTKDLPGLRIYLRLNET